MQKDLIILDEDKAWACRRVAELDAERQQLKAILQNSLPSIPKQPKGKIGIGTYVILDTEERYFIAGDWTPYAGETKDGAVVVSRNAPLARALLNKKVGQQITIGGKVVVLEEISAKGGGIT